MWTQDRSMLLSTLFRRVPEGPAGAVPAAACQMPALLCQHEVLSGAGRRAVPRGCLWVGDTTGVQLHRSFPSLPAVSREAPDRQHGTGRELRRCPPPVPKGP